MPPALADAVSCDLLGGGAGLEFLIGCTGLGNLLRCWIARKCRRSRSIYSAFHATLANARGCPTEHPFGRSSTLRVVVVCVGRSNM
jgi:hypothetical protein